MRQQLVFLFLACLAVSQAVRVPEAVKIGVPTSVKWGNNDPVRGEGEVVANVRSVAPFKKIDVGSSGCFPMGVLIQSGSSHAVEVAVQANLDSLITTDVSGDTLHLSISAPGIASTADMRITVTVPDETIDEILIGSSGGNVLAKASVARIEAGGQGWVQVEDNGKAGPGSLKVEQKGQSPVAVCSASPRAVSDLKVTLSGQNGVLVSGYKASASHLDLTGMGDIYLRNGASGRSDVKLSGTGNVVVESQQCHLSLTGMGDIYVRESSAITGAMTGMGNVYYNHGSCSANGGMFAKCIHSSKLPPQKVQCTQYTETDVFTRGKSIQVSPSGQCQTQPL